jgi:ribosomal-protein-alanine N-acetyltransferase
MDFILREMNLEDVEAVSEIEELSFHTPWSADAFKKEITENKLAIYIVCEVDGVVRGYGGMWRIVDEGHITNIAVHPDFRRMHIGSSLIIGLFSAAEKNDISRLTLEVRESNLSAQRMYKRFGFKQEGLRKRYYEDNKENALIMWAEV